MVRLQDYSVTEVHVLLGFQKSGPWLSSVFRGIAEKQLLNTSGTKKKNNKNKNKNALLLHIIAVCYGKKAVLFHAFC